MSTLIVCLPSVDASLAASYAYLRSNDGSKSDSYASATAPLLPAPERAGELIVVVPAAALSWHGVDLPDGITASSPRLRAILEGLLEDRLLDDLSTVHLALAPTYRTAAKSLTWVAACNKAWLNSHLQALEAAHHPVARVVPEYSPDLQALQLHAVGDADSSCWVAIGAAVGGLMRLPFSAAALKVVQGSGDKAQWEVFAEPGLAAQAEQFTQSPVALLTRPQRWLEAAQSPWELAQFDLAKTARSRRVKKLTALLRDLARAPQWRLARWGVGLLVLANLAGLNVSAWQHNASLVASRAEIKNTLVQTFPQVRVVVDAPLQMQRELAVLRQSAGVVSSRDMEVMLAALGNSTAPDYAISTISYSAGELRVKGVAGAAQDAASVSALMKPRGFTVTLDGDSYVVKPSVQAGQ